MILVTFALIALLQSTYLSNLLAHTPYTTHHSGWKETTMFDYFETKDAIYSIVNGKHYKHLKSWDAIPSFRYYKIEISVSEYVKAYRAISADTL